jgi:sarcosine oxidase subunit delta
MFEIKCPWCGVRDEREFTYGGETGIIRPNPDTTDDAGWAEYLYYRTNTKGAFKERWRHTFGCGQWFNAVRNTATHEIIGVYKMGEPAPDVKS